MTTAGSASARDGKALALGSGDTSPLLVLGLDPGSHVTGYGLVECTGARVRSVTEGCITAGRSLPVPERLAHICRELRALLGDWRPRAAVVEKTFHGVNARSLIVLAEVRGAMLATLAEAGLRVQEYTPAEVKMAVTGNGRADKTQVARMVRLLLGQARGVSAGEAISSRHDATDALALALCYAQRRKLDELS
jgi:crossover junction endodeoxyribonuclease RuvC